MHCSYSFAFLITFGFWRPRKWDDSKILTAIYTFYSIITFIVLYTLVLSLVINVLFCEENIYVLTENRIELADLLNVSQKNICYLLNRKKIIKLIDYFFDDICLPQTPTEKEIQNSFDNKSKGNSEILFFAYTLCLLMFKILPFFISKPEDRWLPCITWIPYSIESVINYYFAFIHITWVLIIAAYVNGATETLVSGFMIQICAQLAILEQRFMQMPKTLKKMRESGESEETVLKEERKMIVNLIHHHWRIFKLTELFNNAFVFVILSQFVSSITILALTPLTGKGLVTIFFFLICMLLQIFLYTWYGNEITLRSVNLGNQIFYSEWSVLTPVTIKDLLIIAQRTTKPIILSSGYVIRLSNATFATIVKTAYSIFNVFH